MATRGLSLVGFMDAPMAIAHLGQACVPTNADPTVLLQEWTVAQGRLGAPTAKAGTPDIQEISTVYDPHLQQVQTHVAFQPGNLLHGAEFKLVEIDPLLAFQFTVDLERSNHHCGRLPPNPNLAELLNVCLPTTAPHEQFQSIPGQNSILIKARSLNVQKIAVGLFNAEFAGLQFGVSLPYVHVVRHNGRCYLHNGFHRAVGARLAGATHVPCLFRDVADHASVGIRDGVTFSVPVLESANPPTVGHFTSSRAHDVQLRAHSRVLHVSWAEYVVADE